MDKYNYHSHTKYCDGLNTPREMVEAAISKGFRIIGLSGHAHTAHDESYAMSHSSAMKYREELQALKEEYKDEIEVLAGLEYDYYSDEDKDGWDYLIGSVHYVIAPDGEFVPVDESPEILMAAVAGKWGGDADAFAEDYFVTVGDVVAKTGCQIIGHFDLLTKFDEVMAKRGGASCCDADDDGADADVDGVAGTDAGGAGADSDGAASKNAGGPIFDVSSDRYVAAYRRALDRLVGSGVPFEINSNAVAKGYRTEFYPSRAILEEIRSRGGRIILSSDAHSCEALDYGFEEMAELARECGFTSRCVLTENGIEEIEL